MLFRSKQLTPVWFLVMSSFAVAQAQPANDQVLRALDSASALVEATEADYGRHDMALVEPLEQLANQLMTLNQFDQADATLDRALQITRLHRGLHTPAQLALIRKRIDNFSNQQAWADAREQMDYLFSFYLRVPVALQETLIDDFLALAEQHLRGAKEDTQIERGRHLSRIHQINQAIIYTARQLYGETSPELAPHLYRQVRHIYLFKKGFDEGGRTRANANFYYPLRGQTFGWRKKQFKQTSYTDGLWLLAQIERLYSEGDSADPIGQAMAQLYRADWQMLYDYAAEAKNNYESAYAALQDAGVSQRQLNRFFSQPRVLPLQRFHSSVAAAIGSDSSTAESSQNSAQASAQASTEAMPTHRLSFEEWSTDYPTTSDPLLLADTAQGDPDYALFEFSLPNENESTFLYKHRYKQTIGDAYDVRLLDGFDGLPLGNEQAMARIEQMRFRPRMPEGVPVESQIRLQYGIAVAAD